MSDNVKTVDQFIATAKAETGEVWMDNHDWQHLIEMVEGLQAELQQAREALKTILEIPLSEADYFDDISTGYHAGVSSCKKIASAALPTPPEQEANG